MSEELATLCQRCGLCCDGSLFTQVPLGAGDEAAAVRRRGLTVVARADGSPALRQPCAALDGRRCAIYEDRPASCRGYRCMLYAALAEGEVSLAEALATVERAHELLAAARACELAPETGEAGVRARAFVERRFRGLGGR